MYCKNKQNTFSAAMVHLASNVCGLKPLLISAPVIFSGKKQGESEKKT